eukprot:gene4155-8258_t
MRTLTSVLFLFIQGLPLLVSFKACSRPPIIRNVLFESNVEESSQYLNKAETKPVMTLKPYLENNGRIQNEETVVTTGGDEPWEGTFKLALELLSLDSSTVSIVAICDRIDAAAPSSRQHLLLNERRKMLLADMLRRDRKEYINTVTFLGNRIPRCDLPNVQEIPYPDYPTLSPTTSTENSEMIQDCALPKKSFSDSPLDKVLLAIFRNLVQKEIRWKSDIPGILGLLEEGRHYMLSPEGSHVNQHQFVKATLAGLMTPFLPPFYRIFMSGIVPSEKRNDPKWLVDGTTWLVGKLPESLQSKVAPGTQLGPWFYAPALTSFVTPPFLNFLVGPSRMNRRKNGQIGGMVVEKCKFLQESGCKGLCLHQCKIPAQEFFAEELGLALTVSPNFETQECQWSWGEVPLPVEQDASFPKGCLVGCPSRDIMREKGLASSDLMSSCNRA